MDRSDVPLDVLRLAEALVFASPEPVTWKTLAPLLPSHLDADRVFRALQLHCADRGVVLVEHDGGWVFRTAADLAGPLRSVLGERRKLPRVALEVLVVIALHQPITRTEIEDMRGVALAQATMDLLLEAGMITSHGRKQTAGSPSLWVTTPLFLAQFGLRSISDIPGSHLPLPVPGGRAGKGSLGSESGIWRDSSEPENLSPDRQMSMASEFSPKVAE